MRTYIDLSKVEKNIVIMAACVPTLRSLFNRTRIRMRADTAILSLNQRTRIQLHPGVENTVFAKACCRAQAQMYISVMWAGKNMRSVLSLKVLCARQRCRFSEATMVSGL